MCTTNTSASSMPNDSRFFLDTSEESQQLLKVLALRQFTLTKLALLNMGLGWFLAFVDVENDVNVQEAKEQPMYKDVLFYQYMVTSVWIDVTPTESGKYLASVYPEVGSSDPLGTFELSEHLFTGDDEQVIAEVTERFRPVLNRMLLCNYQLVTECTDSLSLLLSTTKNILERKLFGKNSCGANASCSCKRVED